MPTLRLTHAQTQDALLAAADDRLSGAQQAELQAHLAECPACRAQAAELEALQRELGAAWAAQLQANPVPAPPPVAALLKRRRAAMMNWSHGLGYAALIGMPILLIGLIGWAFQPRFAAYSTLSSATPVPLSTHIVRLPSATPLPSATLQPTTETATPLPSQTHILLVPSTSTRSARDFPPTAQAGNARSTNMPPDSFSGPRPTGRAIWQPTVSPPVVKFQPSRPGAETAMPVNWIDGSQPFPFGANVKYQNRTEMVAQIQAFQILAGETPPADKACYLTTEVPVPTDRISWSAQRTFAPGGLDFSASFNYQSVKHTTHLVIWVHLLVQDAVMFCQQYTYPLFFPPATLELGNGTGSPARSTPPPPSTTALWVQATDMPRATPLP